MTPTPFRYFILFKPRGMVSQFVSPDPVTLLSHLPYPFPEGTHAVGRLDSDSEGLLVLTTNKGITRLLFSSGTDHRRTYIVQVKDHFSEANLERIRSGITIPLRGKPPYTTRPCEAAIISRPAWLAPQEQEIASGRPHTWLQVTLTEGKFRQVRKMFKATGCRVVRLVRVSIEGLELGDLQQGELRELEEQDFFSKVFPGGVEALRSPQSPAPGIPPG